MKNIYYGIVLTVALSVASIVRGIENSAPFYIGNQNPFVQIYGLPKAESGFITPKGQLNAAFLYYVSNNAFSDYPGNGESMIWDGETAQYSLNFRYGVADWLELGVDLPYIQHSGGYLDSVIRNFHSLVGFPNDRQEEFKKNQIEYLVEDQDGDGYHTTSSHSGIGDLRLTAAAPLFDESISSRRYLAVRSVLKLPTGDSDSLLGSGGTDLSGGLSYSDLELLSFMNTALHANLGLLYLGDGDVLSDKQENIAGFGGVSLDWMVLKWLSLKLQFDMHTALYDSELVQLGSSMQLLGGGTLILPGEVLVDFGISEQMTTDATPDVGFFLMVKHLF